MFLDKCLRKIDDTTMWLWKCSRMMIVLMATITGTIIGGLLATLVIFMWGLTVLSVEKFTGDSNSDTLEQVIDTTIYCGIIGAIVGGLTMALLSTIANKILG